MDGNYQMIKFNNIEDWFNKIQPEIKKSKSVDIDLDYFLKRNKDPLCFVKKGIVMLNELVVLCKKKGIIEDYMPSIIIPLKCIKASNIAVFNSNNFDLVNEIDSMSPGDICLINRDENKYYVMLEEYKYPLKIELPIKLNKNCKIYYHCFRNEEELKHNWEFYRYISIKHYTDRLIN
ncbi:hypothetical protein [Candidatus Bandiella euplotis]|uniref:Uncharacterized protein n=1 Tax=Candidatus Bandiella euplotis TaxID=1664265 RepID=A0ABZ0UMK6_9RICK|nr:hypothetical protein [Candidatus Bandiella woodruffii]WPX97403.1 hypothetical protein Bandiella_01555 [Candidatus Bandiella woodruffii]